MRFSVRREYSFVVTVCVRDIFFYLFQNIHKEFRLEPRALLKSAQLYIYIYMPFKSALFSVKMGLILSLHVFNHGNVHISINIQLKGDTMYSKKRADTHTRRKPRVSMRA